MPYFICFIASFSLFYAAENNRKATTGAFWFLAVPLIVYWTLLIGLQDNVGADYHNYIKMFANLSMNNRMLRNNELLFYQVAKLVITNNWAPQMGFIIIAFIQITAFFVFVKLSGISKPSFLIFVYFTVSTAFVNQTNGLRQYTAVYLFTIAMILLMKKNVAAYLILIFIASLFHRSALLMIPAFILPIISAKMKPVHFVVMILSSLVLSMMNIIQFITPLVELTSYAYYLEKDYFSQATSMTNKLTKYIFIPFYLLSLRSLRHLDKIECRLFALGFISYCLRLILLPFAGLNRVSMYFEVLQVLPLYFFMLHLFNGRCKIKYTKELVLLGFFVITAGVFAAKVILFPVGEYAYKSIL